jgi:hypothetical protein
MWDEPEQDGSDQYQKTPRRDGWLPVHWPVQNENKLDEGMRISP